MANLDKQTRRKSSISTSTIMDNVSNIDLGSCQLSKVKLNNNPIKI